MRVADKKLAPRMNIRLFSDYKTTVGGGGGGGSYPGGGGQLSVVGQLSGGQLSGGGGGGEVPGLSSKYKRSPFVCNTFTSRVRNKFQPL